MPDKVVAVPGVGNVAFPDTMSDEDIGRVIQSQHPELAQQQQQQTQAPPSWADQMGIRDPVGRQWVDLAEGAKSGLASTIYHGGDLIRRATGMQRVIDDPGVQAAMTPPDSIAGKAGRFAEQTGEFFVPGGIAADTLKGAPLAARMAGQAIASGATAGVQSGGQLKPTAVAATLGAGGELAGAALPEAADWLSESAQKGYNRVLGATKAGNKYLSETQVTPGLIERGTYAISMKGLQKQAQQSLQQTGQLIGDAWGDLPAGTSVELQPVWDKLESSAQDALTIPTAQGPKPTTVYAAKALDSLDQMKSLLLDVAETDPQTGKLVVPTDKLLKLRQTWDGVAALGKRYQGAQLADYAAGEVHGLAADSIREELGKQFPDIDALNKEYSFWKNVNQVVSDTITRRTGQAKPLGQKLAAAAGTAAGFVTGGIKGAVLGREAMQAVEKVTGSTAWGTVSAVMKSRLADAIAAGDTQAVLDLTSRMGASIAAQSSADEDQPTPGTRYRQAVAQPEP